MADRVIAFLSGADDTYETTGTNTQSEGGTTSTGTAHDISNIDISCLRNNAINGKTNGAIDSSKDEPLITLLLTLSHSISTSQHPDLNPLMASKSSTSDPNNTLSSWTPTTTNSCSSNWFGVTCINNRISHIILEGLGLHAFPSPPHCPLHPQRPQPQTQPPL
ncbi:hypothetical protein Syun_029921 [Stephania yunnanensis]|uniref:Leucine-rich repeat-containing N-terminal plant-type domain-containing protein n=1 Tax=Stephania yunnanensis TaxID=152371 RepID=A0AAP0EB08_9MAGN